MPDVIITTPAPIVAQVKGGKSTAIVQTGSPVVRLSELVDVNTQGVQDGYVLAYSSANGRFEATQINAGTF